MAKRDNEGDWLYVYRRLYFPKKTIKRARERDENRLVYIYGEKKKKNVFITFWTPRITTHACRRKNENKNVIGDHIFNKVRTSESDD